VRAANRVPKPDRKRVFGVQGALADRAVAAFAAIGDGSALALPAWRRYTGVVWEHLDPASLTAAQRRRIVVVSALMGAVGGDEPVPDHRLKLSVSLGRLGRLDRWWRPAVTEALALRGRGPIVDLLPREHAAAVDWDVLAERREVLRVPGVGTGHAGKADKGRLARALLQEGRAALP
jgi:cytoplasmic iron level regulating protein YaaA (DUF328/UPF0246 family)